MTLINIRAALDCDGCGNRITIDLDAADTKIGLESWHDLVIDAVRGGVVREDGYASVQGSNQCLCPDCTTKVDAFVTEDRAATDEEIRKALEE